MADNSGGADTGRVFVSYRRSDTAHVVGRIHDRLETQFGPDVVFRDVDDVPLGVDFRARVSDALDESSVVLVVIGPTWLEPIDESGRRRLDDSDDVVRIEIEEALVGDVVVIPLLIGGAAMPSRELLPKSLHGLVDRNGIAIRPDPDFSNDVRRLAASIEPHVGERTIPTVSGEGRPTREGWLASVPLAL